MGLKFQHSNYFENTDSPCLITSFGNVLPDRTSVSLSITSQSQEPWNEGKGKLKENTWYMADLFKHTTSWNVCKEVWHIKAYYRTPSINVQWVIPCQAFQSQIGWIFKSKANERYCLFRSNFRIWICVHWHRHYYPVDAGLFFNLFSVFLWYIFLTLFCNRFCGLFLGSL